jgi:hypothetical protein
MQSKQARDVFLQVLCSIPKATRFQLTVFESKLHKIFQTLIHEPRF